MSKDSSSSSYAPVDSKLAEPAHAKKTYAKVPWGPWMAIFYALLVYFVAQIIASFLILAYPHLRGWNSARGTDWVNNATTAQFWFVVFAEALTFYATWWFIKRRKSSLRAIGWRAIEVWDVARALAGFAAYFIGYAILLAVATKLFHSLNANQKQDLGFSHVAGDTNLILTFISLVVLPPIVEETVFRGFLFTGIRNVLRPVNAAIVTSVLFAVPHLLESGQSGGLLWVAGIDTFTLSLVLCYLRHKTDSLWPGILLHAIKNGLAFLTLYVIHSS